MADDAVLCGKDPSNIDFEGAEAPLHKDVVMPFLALQARAKEAGFDLAIASSYRDYDRQLAIWNAKLNGSRPVYDTDSSLLSLATLSPWEQVQAVLRWSALPGASRHHWGTDIDVYDRAAVPRDYQVQLSIDEVGEEGPFGSLHDWLDKELVENAELGFFRPYQCDRGGVAPERWHLSYAPVAACYQREYGIEKLYTCCQQGELLLKSCVLSHLEEIYTRFIDVPAEEYPPDYQY